MAQALIDLRRLPWPEAGVDAAAFFYREVAPRVRAALAGEAPAGEEGAGAAPPGEWSAGRGAQAAGRARDLDAVALAFPLADHSHRAWRLAAVQALAVEAVPRRVNGIVGGEDAAVHAMAEWIVGAEAITGQLLEVAGVAREEG